MLAKFLPEPISAADATTGGMICYQKRRCQFVLPEQIKRCDFGGNVGRKLCRVNLVIEHSFF